MREHISILRCPDDGYLVIPHKDASFLECEACKRKFPIFAENVVELLPAKPFFSTSNTGGIGERYFRHYIHLLQQRFEWKPAARGWGDLETATRGRKVHICQERRLIEKYLAESLRGTFLDISGGSGSFSLYFARLAKLTVHLDLSIDAINHSYYQAKQRNLPEILFLRGDYLQIPLASSIFDSVICTSSTFGNGFSVDLQLLAEIIRCLKPGGRLFTDFPNKSRLPRFLAGRLKMPMQEAPYDSDDLSAILNPLPIKVIDIIPFQHVPTKLVFFSSSYQPLDWVFRRFSFPPAQWVVVAEKKQNNIPVNSSNPDLLPSAAETG